MVTNKKEVSGVVETSHEEEASDEEVTEEETD